MDVILSNYAWVRKKDLTEEQLYFLKTALTVYPLEFRPKDAPKEIKLFQETNTAFGIPRAFFLNKKKPHHNIIDKTIEGDSLVFTNSPLVFKGELRPVQQPIYDSVMKQINDGIYGGILSLATGFGKSILALKIIEQLKKPALIIVNKEFLLDQWLEYIQQFLPDAKVGKAQQDTCIFKGKHIVLGMIHSLSGRDYPKEFYEHFGVIITDEMHHLGSESWSAIAPKFCTKLRLGLSATVNRADQADNCFFYHIGPIIATASAPMMVPKIKRVYTDFHLVETAKFNPKNLPEPTLINILCKSVKRNKLIVDQLIAGTKTGRKILVLSGRVKHLKNLQVLFQKEWVKKEATLMPTTGLYIGEQDKEDLELAAKADIMFGTYTMIAEAFNRPELDTLFLTTPMSNIVQVVGRILRESKDKRDPWVIDFRDDQVDSFKSKGEKRDDQYAMLKEAK